MPCTLKTLVPTGGGANVVSVPPLMSTVSLGAEGLIMRKLFVERPPVSDVRTTVSGPLILMSEPSYCSKNEFVGSWFSWVVVPTKNGGSGLPELTLRTMKFGEPKLPFGASISRSPAKLSTLANSATIESPTAKLYGADFVLTLWVKKSMPWNGPPPDVSMNASKPVAIGSKPMMMPPTPITVSPTAGLHAPPFFTWKIDTESVHVAFGNVVAEATPAMHTSAANARKRVNI